MPKNRAYYDDDDLDDDFDDYVDNSKPKSMSLKTNQQVANAKIQPKVVTTKKNDSSKPTQPVQLQAKAPIKDVACSNTGSKTADNTISLSIKYGKEDSGADADVSASGKRSQNYSIVNLRICAL